jgi:murein DD-endopeptidase MepM/ murein hydrolase activator NlpD
MAYESRISELSRQIDNLLSRQIVERTTIEQEMAELAQRQEELTERQELLTGLAADAIEVGINVLPAAAPLPMGNPLRTGSVEIGPAAMGGPVDPMNTGAIRGTGGPFNPMENVAMLAAAAERLELDQAAALATLAIAVEDRTRELARALGNLGYAAGVTLDNAGGPLIAIDPDQQDVAAIADDLAALADLRAYALSLPLGLPIPSIEVTSGYGPRRDPFLGQSAMHTGVDLVAASGTPVHATGPGTVVIADVNGGYGKMVEIDHGHGVLTTYAHLSLISVREGQTVTAGTIVGRAGSTGRSTGPHLHYEITRDGRTIDPLPHIRTGPQIGELL